MVKEKELVIVIKPEIPNEWDYGESIKKAKGVLYKWKGLTIEIAQELWVAREILSTPGKRTDLTSEQKFQGWDEYCQDIGSSRQVVNRWLTRWFEPEKLEQEKAKLDGSFDLLPLDKSEEKDAEGEIIDIPAEDVEVISGEILPLDEKEIERQKQEQRKAIKEQERLIKESKIQEELQEEPKRESQKKRRIDPSYKEGFIEGYWKAKELARKECKDIPYFFKDCFTKKGLKMFLEDIDAPKEVLENLDKVNEFNFCISEISWNMKISGDGDMDLARLNGRKDFIKTWKQLYYQDELSDKQLDKIPFEDKGKDLGKKP